MTREQFEREAGFGAAMSVADNLFAAGLIDRREYGKIDTRFKVKYQPAVAGLIRRKP